MSLLNAPDLWRLCAAEAKTVTAPTHAAHWIHGRSRWQPQDSPLQHAEQRRRHCKLEKSVSWTDPTFTLSEARSQPPCSNAFEFEGR